MNKLRILIFGDIVGAPGREVFQKHVDHLREQYKADVIIVNGENSGSQGRGITSRIMHFFKHNNVDVVTSGNHIWYDKEIYKYLNEHDDLLRPENYPSICPGKGVTTFTTKDIVVGVINLQGRIFMRENLDDPFKTAQSVLTYLKSKTNVILVDFHAEATSEKLGLAYYLDGQVSAVVGTHTHVQTADERILPFGTAFITDLGMAGSLNSMIGMKKDSIIEGFLMQMPKKFIVETQGPMVLCGVCVEVDTQTGLANSIERFRIVDDIHLEAGQEK